MEMCCIMIVEDKPEEQENALEAVKRALNLNGEPFGVNLPLAEFIGTRYFIYGEVGGETGVMIWIASHLAAFKGRLGFLDSKMFPKRLILTDLMFPADKRGKENMNGIEVIIDAIEGGIPVVVCSDTDHHDVPFMPRLIGMLEKQHPMGHIPVVLDKKDWERAVARGLTLLNE